MRNRLILLSLAALTAAGCAGTPQQDRPTGLVRLVDESGQPLRCTRERITGSNQFETTCVTVAEQAAERNAVERTSDALNEAASGQTRGVLEGGVGTPNPTS